MKRLISTALAFLLTIGCAALLLTFTAGAEDGYIDLTELDPKTVQVGWGSLCVNKGLDGGSIDMSNGEGGTTVFPKGYTAHAPSRLEFDISGLGAVTMFTASIGAEHSSNNATTTSTSIRFIVYADGKSVYESGVMGYNDPYEDIFVPIPAGTKTLSLVTDDVGGNSGDHSAWGSPKLLTDSSALENLKEIVLSTDKNVYLTGSVVQVNAVFYNLGNKSFTPESVRYETSDPTVATVSQTGVVTSLKEGSVRITVTAEHKGTRLSKTTAITFMDKADPRTFTFKSPAENLILDLTLDDQGALSYVLNDKDGVSALERSAIGVETELCDFSNALIFEKQIRPNAVDETYHNISGKRSTVRNHYSETVLTFKKDVYFFDLYVRMYDDGFAYRFAIRRADGERETLNVVSETGTFALPAKSWMSAQNAPSLTSSYSYEDGYYSSQVDKLAKSSHPCFPATFTLYNKGEKTGKYLLLSEADYFGSGYAGSVLTCEGNGVFGLTFAPKFSVGTKVTVETGFLSPWRFGIYGNLADIVESDMTENLAPAPEGDFSWVEPGVTAWMWLSEGFQGQRTEATIREYIDMASEMGWKYLILDEGWQPESKKAGKKYDGYFKYFPSLIEYADSKGVGFIAWVKYCDLDTPEEREVLVEWASIGIKGIKADFFDSEDPDTLAGFRAIYEKCAENHLIVNCHGASKPTGERRTYPNVINREAVNGEEYGGLWMSGAMHWVYARNVLGPIDITPRLYSTDSGNNTTTAQMACNVIFESGIPCMASDSEDYLKFNCNSFYKNLPAAWDDLVFIDGAVGAWASLARRAGDIWYAASMSCGARENIVMPLDFLDDGNYFAIIYSDLNRTDVGMSVKRVTNKDSLTYSLQKNGGYVVKLVKADAAGKFVPSGISAPENLTVYTGFRDTVDYTLVGEDIQIPDVIFESSDPTIAEVSESGVVTGVKEGSAVITVKSLASDDVKTEIKVTVTRCPVRLADRFTVVNETGGPSLKPSFALNGEKKAETNIVLIPANPGTAEGGKPANELRTKLPDGDFKVSVTIAEAPAISGTAAGVAFYAGDKYLMTERLNDGGNFIHLISNFNDEVKVKDMYVGAQSKGMYVTIERKGDVVSIARSFSKKSSGGAVKLTVGEDEELYIGLYGVSGTTGAYELFTFKDFTENGEPVAFAVNEAPSENDDRKDDPGPDDKTGTNDQEDPTKSKEDNRLKIILLISIVSIAGSFALCVMAAVVVTIVIVAGKKKKQ